MPKVLIFDGKEQAERAVPLNKVIKVKIDEKTICLTRTHEGYFAFEKDCPHMSDDLGKGKINHLNEIVCPWHAYRFNLKSGEESERRCKELLTYPVIIEKDQMFIEM